MVHTLQGVPTSWLQLAHTERPAAPRVPGLEQQTLKADNKGVDFALLFSTPVQEKARGSLRERYGASSAMWASCPLCKVPTENPPVTSTLLTKQYVIGARCLAVTKMPMAGSAGSRLDGQLKGVGVLQD